MTTDEKRKRADQAKQILDSPIVQEIFDGLEQKCIAELCAAPAGSDELRLELILRIKTVRDLKVNLHRAVMLGEYESRKKATIA
jgi:hypothetical protein